VELFLGSCGRWSYFADRGYNINMENRELIDSLIQKIDELTDSVKSLSDKQNSQYTDVMMELKQTREDISRIEASVDEIETNTAKEEGTSANVDKLTEDELYQLAKEAVIKANKASASYLQRKFEIGYARAARLLDMLEENGIIGPGIGATPRKVFKTE
jgi:DNA segregation ATPase FtsK/SpoIIIE-like protein